MPTPSELLRGMEEIAGLAAGMALSHFGRITPCVKSDSSYVTKADMEIEALLRRELPALVKDAAIVGEETTLTPDNAKLVRSKEWVWVIDPIDGTGNFVDGLPNFCVSIGLARNGWPYAGVIRFPIGGDTYRAVMDYGAFYNGKRITLKGFKPGANTVFYNYSESHASYKIDFPGKIRNLGTAAGHFAVTARGAGCGVLARGAVWDFMGAAPVFLEAGGIMRYVDGTKIHWPSTLTLPGTLKMPVIGALPGKWKKTAGMIIPI